MSQMSTVQRERDSRAPSKRSRSSRRPNQQGGRALRLEGLEQRSMLSVSACILVSGEGENPMWVDGSLEHDVRSIADAEQVGTAEAGGTIHSGAAADRVEPAADDPAAREEDALPLPRDDAFSISDDQQLGGSVLTNDLAAAGQELAAAVVAGPQHGTLVLNSDGLFIYQPDRGFSGTDTFSYRVAGGQEALAAAALAEGGQDAADGGAAGAVGTVTIAVASSNQAPASVEDSYSVGEDQTLVVDVAGLLDNDTDADGDPLTARLVGAPAHGTVMLTGDGLFQYTPNPDFFGNDSFAYVANDGLEDSEPATVSIVVAAANDAPTAVEDDYATREGETLVVDAPGVLANDVDIDGDALTAVLVDDPLHGTVVLAADGSFEYTPEADFHGTDRFTYTAGDGLADSPAMVVEITVTPIDLAVQLQVSGDAFAAGVQTGWAGATFWVNAYVQDLRDTPQGVVGGAIDILFDPTLVAPTGGVVYGEAFDLFQQGTADPENGRIDEAGAISTETGVGVDGLAPLVAWEFVSLVQPGEGGAGPHVQFVVEIGQGDATVTPADFALIGWGQPVPAERIALQHAEIDLYFADFNLDGAVDHFDLALWQPQADSAPDGPSHDPVYDLNADQAIDDLDLDLLTAVMYRPTTWAAADSGDALDVDSLAEVV